MYLDADNIEAALRYRKPEPHELPHFAAMQDAFVAAARAICAHTPQGAERTLAIRKLQECRMWANAAIVLGEPMPDHTPGDYAVHLRCTAECDADAVTVIMRGETRFYAELYAGLLDGSSPTYVIDPREDPNTTIGKCAHCMANLVATVEIAEPAA